jgi:ribonuclease BN (tRNA processing enzyme)
MATPAAKRGRAAKWSAKTRSRFGIALVLLMLTFGLLRWFVRGIPQDDHSSGTKSRNGARSTKELEPWTPGMLDIHHLQVGSSVSSFVIMPDGTTLLVDAGDLNVPHMLSQWSAMGPPFDKLSIKSPFPNDSKTPVGWIMEYMKAFWPYSVKNNELELDYLLLSHFHSDHFGDGNADLSNRVKDPSGKYILSGIPELASKIKIKKIIDRGYPDYNVPQDLRSIHDTSIDNYLQFVQENEKSIRFEQFQVGSTQQIRMQNKPADDGTDFRVRVIKSGMDVAAPYEEGRPNNKNDDPIAVEKIPGDVFSGNGHGNENTMSAAFVVEYGQFRYYEGADQEIVRNKAGDIVFDTIGPTARAAGKADVATLNHHGHGVSQDYITYIDPPIMVLQGWSSDQPPKKSIEMLAAVPSKDGGVRRKIFATDMFQERLDDLGHSLSKLFQSTSGHIVVRVHPPSKAVLRRRDSPSASRQTFEIVVLDGDRKVKTHYGYFPVRAKQ